MVHVVVGGHRLTRYRTLPARTLLSYAGKVNRQSSMGGLNA